MFSTSLVAVMLGGCFEPTMSADELGPGQEPGSLFGVDAGTGSGSSGCAAGALSSLHVRIRTTQYGGRYAPRNIGAIWVEDSAGKFVKTIELWAKTRSRWLTRWKTASAGNVVDAVTGATMSSHVTHDRTWNLMGTGPCQVPAGDYRVVVETTDYNGTGASLAIPITKGQAPVTVTPTETTNFHDLLVELK